MVQPYGFSWIQKPHLAALAAPDSKEDLRWLREQGIQLLITLTEWPVPREWINDAGLMSVHEAIEDFHAPRVDQVERCVSAIVRAKAQNLGVAVHCAAGLGRTGTILAAFLVHEGLAASEAIAHVRQLRPGSIETYEQEESVRAFEAGLKGRSV